MKTLGLAALVMVVGCGDGGSAVVKPIGSAGGSVSNTDGTTIVIPNGALVAEAQVSITPTPNAAAPGGTVLVGTPQTFGPENTSFAKPVTVTLPFDASKLPAGKTSADISIWSAPAGTTTYVPSEVTTVADASHVSTSVQHFSVFVAAVRMATAACTVSCTKSTSGCGCTATCDGTAYALECNSLGACSCKTAGTETKVIETNSCANETSATLFGAYNRTTNGCGYPGTQPAG